MTGELRSLTDLLSSTLAGLGVDDLPMLLTLIDEWPDLVAAPWAEHSRPVIMRQGTLIVEALSASAVRLLRYGEQDLVRVLQARFGARSITAVEVVAPSRPGASGNHKTPGQRGF